MAKQKTEHRFQTALHILLSPALRLFLRLHYGCRFQKTRLKNKDHYLILANHVNFLDPLILEVAFDRPICLVANADFFALGAFRFLAKLTPLIPIEKGTLDLASVRKCVQYLRNGGNLALYPEGNQTFSGKLCYIKPSIVKLVRLSQTPLMYFTFTGGFGTKPRFGNGVRRGKMISRAAVMRSVAEIAAMSDDALYRDILNNLDAEEIPSSVPFPSSKSAEYLERMIYYCPVCRDKAPLYSAGRRFCCPVCGLTAEYRDDLTFNSADPDFPYLTVKDWFDAELRWLAGYVPRPAEVIYRDQNGVLERLEKGKFVKIAAGEVTMTDAGFSVGDATILLDAVDNMIPVTAQKLRILTKDASYRVDGPPGFGNIKYIHMFHRLRQLHRGVNDGYYGT